MQRIPVHAVCLSLVLASCLGGCEDHSTPWIERPLETNQSLVLDGITVGIDLPDPMVVRSQSDDVATIEPSAESGEDRYGMTPMITLTGVPSREMPRSADSPEILGDVEVTSLPDGRLRARNRLETTVSDHYFVPRGAGGFVKCAFVMYGGRGRSDVPSARVEAWGERVCSLTVD